MRKHHFFSARKRMRRWAKGTWQGGKRTRAILFVRGEAHRSISWNRSDGHCDSFLESGCSFHKRIGVLVILEFAARQTQKKKRMNHLPRPNAQTRRNDALRDVDMTRVDGDLVRLTGTCRIFGESNEAAEYAQRRSEYAHEGLVWGALDR